MQSWGVGAGAVGGAVFARGVGACLRDSRLGAGRCCAGALGQVLLEVVTVWGGGGGQF